MRQIYRKVALERLSSPEQLDMLMQVTNPQGWIAFVGLALLLAGGLLWSVLTTLPIEITAPVVVHNSAESIIYLSSSESQTVDVGMPVSAIVSGGRQDTVLTGEIVSIASFPTQNAATTLPNPIELRVAFDSIPADLPDAFDTSATVELGSQRPIELIIPLR